MDKLAVIEEAEANVDISNGNNKNPAEILDKIMIGERTRVGEPK
jgi:hypothetical protein